MCRKKHSPGNVFGNQVLNKLIPLSLGNILLKLKGIGGDNLF